MKSKTLFFLAAFIAFSNFTQAYTIQLPTTGQTTSFTTGDDGNLQKGIPWPSPRFTDNGDGTITDNLTGLMWLRDANCIKTNYPSFDTDGTAGDGAVDWQNGLNFVAGINDGTYANCGAGYTDWVLPNINELQSIVNAEPVSVDTWLNSQGFINVHPNNYWSSTTYAPVSVYTWVLQFPAGYSKTQAKTSSQVTYTWPVRGVTTQPAKVWKTGQGASYATGDDGDLQRGAAWPSPRFTDNGDGTITDNLTGLMWLQDANCFGGSRGVSFTSAVSYISNLNANAGTTVCSGYTASFSDWRVPNLKELSSLVDRSQQYNPALPGGHLNPFNNVSFKQYLTGTSDNHASANNLQVYLTKIYIRRTIDMGGGSETSDTAGYLWPVRDAAPQGNAVTLTVTKSGSGSGSGAVTTDTGSLAWNGNQGTAAYNTGATVTLTATGIGSTFTSWSGSGCSGTETCVVTMDSAKNVTATFTLNTYSLTVTKSGQGSGTITPDTGTLQWNGATGSGAYGYGTSVTLTVTPTAGYGFAGWSGGGCSGTGTCVVNMTSAKNVTASFVPAYILQIFKSGQGSGVVTADTGKITWTGNTGSGTYNTGTLVTLTAAPNTGSGFTGWSGGGCSGTGTCVVTMAAAKKVTATFDITVFSLTVTKIGSGSGVVTASPGTLTWTGNTGTAKYNKNAYVILTATPNTGSTFAGWSGGGCSGTATCAVSMNSMINVTAVIETSHAGTIQLPQTGVTTCDDASGYSTACAGTGQDGEYQNGTPWPSPRFTDHGDGTITDNLTGLMWLKDANCITNYPLLDKDGIAGDGLITWQTALNFIKALNSDTNNVYYPKCHAGYHDWAIPNANELQSLVNPKAQHFFSWLSAQGFTGLQGYAGRITGYWTGSYNATSPDQLWRVDLANEGNLLPTARGAMIWLWPVRAGAPSGYADVGKTGQTNCYDANGKATPCAGTGMDGELQRGAAWPTPRFTDNLDGTVTDHLTGLMWLKDAGCFKPQTWIGAFNMVNDINANPRTYNCDGYTASYSNWRLPNINELFSLADFSKAPALPQGHPFTKFQNTYYWSSSPHALRINTGQAKNAWALQLGSVTRSFGYGLKSSIPKDTTNPIYIWPVRASAMSGNTVILSVTKTGSGAGTVRANPGSLIWSGNTGKARYNPGASLTLSASPIGGATFTGWSGGGCSGTGKCVITLNSAQTVTATFGGKSAVAPDIKANGYDGPITIYSNTTLKITISLTAYGDTSSVDWWVLAGASTNNLYHYNLGAGTFLPGATVTHKGPLFDLPSYQVLNFSGLPPGAYTFTFGVDYTPDGVFTNKSGQLFYDSVVVTVK